LAVGIGVLATYLLLVVHGSATLRARLGQRAFHALHALSFPAFWLITAHGILAGSDAHRAGMRAVYLVCSGLVLALTLVRLGELALPRGGRPGERTRGSVDG
jgi:DMSO/TMAO reductase YedYZ heme-binding membrane subunit